MPLRFSIDVELPSPSTWVREWHGSDYEDKSDAELAEIFQDSDNALFNRLSALIVLNDRHGGEDE